MWSVLIVGFTLSKSDCDCASGSPAYAGELCDIVPAC